MTLRAVLPALVAILLAACGGESGEDEPEATAPKPSTPSKRAGAVEVEVLKARDNSTAVVVPVFLAGRGPFPFIVDTGASQSLIGPGLVRRLKLPVVAGSPPVSGVGGSADARYVEVRDWKAGQVRLPRQRVFTVRNRSKNGSAGLLGSDVLSTFGRVTVDYRRQRIVLGSPR